MTATQSAVTEVSFEPSVYIPNKLAGLVDFFGEMKSDQLGKALIMPGGKVEVIFFLEGNDISEFYMDWDENYNRSARNNFSLVFSVANRPQIVSGRRINVLLAMMSPAAAMLMFGIPASELTNRSVDPENFGVDMRPVEDALNSLPTFKQRAEFLERWMFQRIQLAGEAPDFVSFASSVTDLFNDSRLIPNTRQLLDMTGYSTSHANRLSKQWLGLSLERYDALQRYRKALALLNTPMSLAEVASEAGYFDQAHFTHRFTEHSGISPSQYRLTPRSGADTLHVA